MSRARARPWPSRRSRCASGAGGCTRSGEVLRPERRRRAGRPAADGRPPGRRLRARLRGRGRRAALLGRRRRRAARRGDRGCRHRAGAGDRRGRSVDRAGGGQPPHLRAGQPTAASGAGAATPTASSAPAIARRAPIRARSRCPRRRSTCARRSSSRARVLADASVWCWGYNSEGQLGLGDTYPGDDHLEPIQLGTDARLDVHRDRPGARLRHPRARAPLSAGGGTRTRSSVRASPTRSRSARPCRSAATPTGWRSAARSRRPARASATAACGAGASSRAARWPPATPTRARRPAQVPTYSDWSAATVGTFHTCGLRPGGEIWCAGRNTEGQIGAARSRRLRAEHAARRPDQRLGGSARRPLLHLRAQGRRIRLVHGEQHAPASWAPIRRRWIAARRWSASRA